MLRYNRCHVEEVVEPIVNLTPLIDVVFVVLIIFIVIAPLLDIDQIILADSSPAGQKTCSVEECGAIAIQVKADNGVWLNGKKMTLSELQQELKDAKNKFPSASPQLFQDRNASFGTYQSIKNAAETAGFKQLDIILKP